MSKSFSKNGQKVIMTYSQITRTFTVEYSRKIGAIHYSEPHKFYHPDQAEHCYKKYTQQIGA